MIATWQAPLSEGKSSEELLVSFDEGRDLRVLVLPALFDEANKLRRLTIQMMRQLDGAGVDCFLPDLPGCNESLAPLNDQTLGRWRAAVVAAADHVKATHVFAVRAGVLLAPSHISGWSYAAQSGAKLLRGMIRARTIASREAGREERSEQLMEIGRSEGLTLAGWTIGAAMFREFEAAESITASSLTPIAQNDIAGAGLWLRAEPDHDAAQAEALASIITAGAVGQAE